MSFCSRILDILLGGPREKCLLIYLRAQMEPKHLHASNQPFPRPFGFGTHRPLDFRNPLQDLAYPVPLLHFYLLQYVLYLSVSSNRQD